MILVDTSVWVELIRRNFRVSNLELRDFVTCGPVVQEVLQGLDEPLFERFRWGLEAISCLENPLSLEAFLEGAAIFRQGRRKGYTIRSSSDCLVAAIAIRHDVPVWHRDRDFDTIARFTPLRTRRAPRIN